jgi:hypothetical protein
MAGCQTGLASRCWESAQFAGSILSPVRKTAITKIILKVPESAPCADR